jgi:hypothetical protein
VKRPITLGELIEQLSSLPADRYLVFDWCWLKPDGLRSYRGCYSDLAVGFTDAYQSVTVGQFLQECREAVGKTYEGYKGGEYRMSESTPVWVANYGNSTGVAVTKVKDRGWAAVLVTKQVND